MLEKGEGDREAKKGRERWGRERQMGQGGGEGQRRRAVLEKENAEEEKDEEQGEEKDTVICCSIVSLIGKQLVLLTFQWEGDKQ